MSVLSKIQLNYDGVGGPELTSVTVDLHNGRDALSHLSFEDCGFTLLKHTSAVRNWADEAEVAKIHSPEIEALVLSETGCDAALVYPPLVRSPEAAASEEDYAPIEYVHSDFTDDYGLMVRDAERPYRQFLEALLISGSVTQDDIDHASRLAMIQFWRNTGALRPDRPFALCDAQTVPRAHLQAHLVPEYGGLPLAFETFGVKPPSSCDEHRWYTFPELRDDEVIMLRTYDSQRSADGKPFWTPHSAFKDPDAPADAPRRESVEMRALCLWH